MKQVIIAAFLGGVTWHENKSHWAGQEAAHDAAVELADTLAVYDEAETRANFEEMAAIAYPGALSAGRHPIHGTYINNNLEKRWKGWMFNDQFRAGILPTHQRGKS